ncbi:MAG: chalcone isomerase family protein [Planctomycetales bacterium]|nr:chalcone isomerase family protein [Planctomycetales bacterium]MBN8627775.1 chalcone isomerase family protein [Planctomycetota bacterium]
MAFVSRAGRRSIGLGLGVGLLLATASGCSETPTTSGQAATTGLTTAATSTMPAVTGSEPVAMEGIFPVAKTIDVAGVRSPVKLTGQAIRKAMMIKFYQIASYCDSAQSPEHVDALASANCPKQLVLTMIRDVPQSILQRSFKEAFAKNDPEGKFAAESKTMLDHMLIAPLCEGETVQITHLPDQGVACSVRGGEPIVVKNLDFAKVVWNVYMGPNGVCKELRRGLGEMLAAAK